MDSQYKLLSELLLDQAAFITSPKTSLANYWGALPPCPPVSTGLRNLQAKQSGSKQLKIISSPKLSFRGKYFQYEMALLVKYKKQKHR